MLETARGTVHEWQRDHMGHINVRAYVDFFEQAAWQFYTMIGLPPSALREGPVRIVAVQQNMGYKQELQPGDTVVVRTGVVEIREKVLRYRHELFNTETGALSADCEFTVVCIDAGTRKSCPLPPAVAASAAAHLLPSA